MSDRYRLAWLSARRRAARVKGRAESAELDRHLLSGLLAGAEQLVEDRDRRLMDLAAKLLETRAELARVRRSPV